MCEGGKRRDLPTLQEFARMIEDNEFWECEICGYSAKLPEDGKLPERCPKCGETEFLSTITFSQSEGE